MRNILISRKDLVTDALIKSVIAVRYDLEKEFGTGTDLCGKCLIAAERLVARLAEKGIMAKEVEGWCVYEDDSSCSDRCYDEHTWVEAEIYGKWYYIDVTADQFNPCMIDKLGGIIIKTVEEKPACMTRDEPDYLWLEERDGRE